MFNMNNENNEIIRVSLNMPREYLEVLRDRYNTNKEIEDSAITYAAISEIVQRQRDSCRSSNFSTSLFKEGTD